MTPLFSVVMPAYKAEAFLEETVKSVKNQELENWELIIVNDGSPDNTLEVARACAGQDTRIQIVDRENGGVSAARNSGVEKARGEHLAFIDADDFWYPGHLRVLARLLDTAEIAVSAAMFFRDTPGDMEGGEGMQQKEIDGFPANLANRCFIIPTMVGMRTATMRALGGFDEAPEIQHVEDWDLWLRAVDAGLKFSFNTDPTAAYRRHDEAATSDVTRIQKAAVYCIEKRVAAGHSMAAELKRMGARFLRRLGNSIYMEDRAGAVSCYRRSLRWNRSSPETWLTLGLAKTHLLPLVQAMRKKPSSAS